jgi:hypothetical protein
MVVVNESNEAPRWRKVVMLLAAAWLIGLASCSYWTFAG